MKKTLILASVASMIEQFNIENIKILKNLNSEVHVIANFTDTGNISKKQAKKLYETLKKNDIKVFNIKIKRNPFHYNNLIAYKQIKRIIYNENYNIIHLHSPIGGVLGRLASHRLRKKGLKIVYTAHGFHFYKGASIFNWLTYFPIEVFLAKYTDILITINKDDYKIAKKFSVKEVIYIPGVGIDNEKFNAVKVDKGAKKDDFNIPDNHKVIVSVGELNKNKNHETIVKAIAKLKNDTLHYIICGIGTEKHRKYLGNLAQKLNIQNRIHLLGYRTDIEEILQIADVYAFPSYREGLGLACLEAMASGLPTVVSEVRGVSDYSEDGVTGFLFKPNDVDGFAEGINILISDPVLTKKIGINNTFKALSYDKKVVNSYMKRIYMKLLE